ncbi:MAG: phenazine biosynthesis FMN-dependent oxidase PhzG [Jiangellaceae bacterium]
MTADTLTGDGSMELPEFASPPADPIALLRSWIDAAVERGVREPMSVALATTDATGRPSNRTLMIKDVDPRGLVFSTDSGSAKGVDLAARPVAAVVFYWRETLQQIRVTGRVDPLPAAESDALFADRPPEAQATTAASEQSRPLDSEAELRSRAAALLSAGAVARPAGWFGYLLVPDEVEFWHGSTDRLHRRLRYVRGGGGWSTQRLQP